jgi:hypothetical protein
LSELVLLLLNTDRLQQFEDFCQSLFYFYKILTTFNNLEIFEKNLQIVESCKYLVEEQALTRSSNCWKLSVFGRRTSSYRNLQIVESCQYLVEVEQYLQLSTIWRFFSVLVLFLLNTDRLQQIEDFCQSLFYFN